ncbi:MAG: hypothetical protein ACLU5F_10095 [Anaerovoracaceae bacterium]
MRKIAVIPALNPEENPKQLVARVRSHLKRYARLTSAPAGKRHEKKGERIQIRDLVIELGNWRVWKGERELKLPNREFELLCFLRTTSQYGIFKRKAV